MKNEGPPNLTAFSWGCAALCAWCCVQIGERDRNVCMGRTVLWGRVEHVCVCQGTEKTKWAGNRSRVCVSVCY